MNALTMLSPQQTAELLPYDALSDAIAAASIDYMAGRIVSPERQVLPLQHGGILLSMPATGNDIGIHKLVNVCPDNRNKNLPTIHGVVSVYDSESGRPLLLLDGPTVTAHRTAAVSLLAMRTLAAQPVARIAIIGCGRQAAAHLDAIAALYSGSRVDIHGLSIEEAALLAAAHQHLPLECVPASGEVAEDVTVVITLTTSQQPVYHQAARPERLLIGVGAFRPDMAEYAPLPIHGSQIFIDDPIGARHEAGDLIQAGIDWENVASLADAVNGVIDPARPKLFKSVGTAAWDLAAARCALNNLR